MASFPIALVPVVHGEKRPALESWAEYQSRPTRPDEVEKWEKAGYAFAAVTGRSNSGGLVFLDFDRAGAFERWRDLVPQELLMSLAIVSTQKPGRKHVWWRTRKDYPKSIPKNIASDGLGTLIEFRRDGMIGLVPCQHAGTRYTYDGGVTVQGAPLLSDEDSDLLVEAARALNERIVERADTRAELKHGEDVTRPGDDFNRRADIREILEPHGWEIEREREGVRYWRRPGKRRGVSATEGYVEGRLYVFTTEAFPLEAERTYTPFALTTILDYDGDFRASAEALREQGFGESGVPDEFLSEVEAAIAEVKDEIEAREKPALPDAVRELEEYIHDFKRTWDRRRSKEFGDSAPRYDYSLIYYFLAAGFTLPNIVRALWRHRERFKDQPEQTLSAKYLAPKIWHLKNEKGKGEEQATNAAQAEEISAGTKEETLANVNRALGIEIARVRKEGRKDANYVLVMASGEEVPIGPIRNLDTVREFRRVVANYLKVFIRTIPQKSWDPICAALLRAAEEVDDPEAEVEAEVWDLLGEYVEKNSLGTSEEERAGCLSSKAPHLHEDALWLHLPSLWRFSTRQIASEVRSRKALSAALRRMRFRETRGSNGLRWWTRALTPTEKTDLLERANVDIAFDVGMAS